MTEPEKPLEIGPAEAAALLQGSPAGGRPLLLDCRTPSERTLARIDGSRFIPMNEMADRLNEVEDHRDRAIIVYCHGGVRSLAVARFLRESGFKGARSLAGGIDRWSHEVDPTVPRY